MKHQLENTKYGDYIITRYLGNLTWEAKCEKCGLIRTYLTNNIVHSKSKNPGQCTCTASGIEVGQKFGRLTVLNRDLGEHTQRRVYWNCLCECGNTIAVAGKSLKSGNTRSCGCLNDEVRSARLYSTMEETWNKMIGQRSGMLTIIRKADKEETKGRPEHIGYWYCECDCGNHHIVGTSDFMNGKVQSCGCMNSKGEAKITKLLEEHNLQFQKQYGFEDLHSELGRGYYFDFAVFFGDTLSYLIEFDGIQHFSRERQFSQNEDAFDKVVVRDEKKNKYCVEHNIPLIRIPYTQLDKLSIDDLKLETTKFIYRKEGDE